MVKSVQRGNLTISSNTQTVSISSVNTDKSILIMNYKGQTGELRYLASSASGPWEYGVPGGHISSSTQLTFTYDKDYYSNATIYWQVIEYY